jgi:molecular chaperone DnaJ
MATIPDYYEILGIGAGAPVDQVRSAYRKLAARYHPDRNPGNREMEQKFRKISEAYTILSDEGNRRKYDAYRQAKQAGWEMDVTVEAAPAGPSYTYPVADVSLEIELGQGEQEQGCLKAVSVSRQRRCPDCNGNGSLRFQNGRACIFCMGAGCANCGGQGHLEVLKCNRCWGTGSDKEQTRLIVTIPAGTPLGSRQRFLASGILWDRLVGMFYVDAFVKLR